MAKTTKQEEPEVEVQVPAVEAPPKPTTTLEMPAGGFWPENATFQKQLQRWIRQAHDGERNGELLVIVAPRG